MNQNQILIDFAEALATDTDLSAWCNATYAKTHQVFVNFDRRNPPGEDACPFIAIYPVGPGRFGRALRREEILFEVACVIFDSQSYQHPGIDNITEYTGVQHIETMRDYVIKALGGVDLANAMIEIVDIDYDTIESFPFMFGIMTLSIANEITLGIDPLD